MSNTSDQLFSPWTVTTNRTVLTGLTGRGERFRHTGGALPEAHFQPHVPDGGLVRQSGRPYPGNLHQSLPKTGALSPGQEILPLALLHWVNLARDSARKKTWNPESASTLNPESLSGCNSPGEQHDRMCESLEFLRLEKALDELPVNYREALILRYHDECSMREIAAALNLSVSAAKMRVHRGLDMLREQYKGVTHEPQKRSF